MIKIAAIKRKEAKIESEIIKNLEKQGYFVRGLEGKRKVDSGVSDLMVVSSEGKVTFLETKTPEEFDAYDGGLSMEQLMFLLKVGGKIVTMKSGVIHYRDPLEVKDYHYKKIMKKAGKEVANGQHV